MQAAPRAGQTGSAKSRPREPVGLDCRIGPTDLTIMQPGGSRSTRPVTIHKMSPDCLTAQHRGYIHLGSACEVIVPTLECRERVMLTGQVLTCDHVSGNTHETRLRLDSRIDPGHYLHTPADYKAFADTGDAAQLEADVLVIEPSEAVRRVIRHQLRDTRIEPVLCSALPQREAGQCPSYDAAMIRVEVGDAAQARSDAASLRRMGILGPIVALRSPDAPPAAELLGLGFDDALTTPFGRSDLLSVLEHVLGRARDDVPAASPIRSELPRDPSTSELVSWYLDHVGGVIGGIRKAMQWADIEEVRSHCRMLAETAASYGYVGVTRQAERTLECLERSGSLVTATAQIDDLMHLCHRLE